jgi:DNA-binding CsgD family transcriptional regulator
VPCETCRRTGWLRRRRGLTVVCLACDGTGWRRRQRDEAEWDSYLLLPVAEAVQLPVEHAHRPPERPAEEEPSYGWERLRASYEARGSYREVRRRLGALGESWPRRQRLIRLVLVEAQPVQTDEHDLMEIDLGVVWIAMRMRSVRVPPWLLEHSAARDREQTIALLAADGFGAGEIARRTGISKQVVRRRLKKLPMQGVDFGAGRSPHAAT